MPLHFNRVHRPAFSHGMDGFSSGDLPWHAGRKKKNAMLCYAMLCYPPPPPPSSSPPPCDMSRSQNEDKMSRCHSSLTCEDVKLSSCLSCQDVTCHARLLDCWLASFVTTDTRFGTSEGTIQCLQEISIAFWVHGFVCDDSYTVWGLLGDDAMPAGN